MNKLIRKIAAILTYLLAEADRPSLIEFGHFYLNISVLPDSQR